MLYNEFKELSLSNLGFGAMRLPVTGKNGPVDEKKVFDMVEYAYDHGVNYFDTAFFYHGGQSERVMGKALARFPRDTWYLADKLPGNFMTRVDGGVKLELGSFKMGDLTFQKFEEIINLQLERCGVDYFDFYLLHNLSRLRMISIQTKS